MPHILLFIAFLRNFFFRKIIKIFKKGALSAGFGRFRPKILPPPLNRQNIGGTDSVVCGEYWGGGSPPMPPPVKFVAGPPPMGDVKNQKVIEFRRHRNIFKRDNRLHFLI